MEYRVQGQSIRSQVVPADVEAFLDGGKSYLRVWSGPRLERMQPVKECGAFQIAATVCRRAMDAALSSSQLRRRS